jgi:hypothetical protein
VAVRALSEAYSQHRRGNCRELRTFFQKMGLCVLSAARIGLTKAPRLAARSRSVSLDCS